MSRYSLRHLINLGVDLFAFHCQSRRQLNYQRKTAAFLNNINVLTSEQQETVAHTDTLNYLLVGMPDSGLQGVVQHAARTLIRGKVLDSFRFDGDEFRIAIDATELFRCKHKEHCEHCLKVEHSNGNIDYYHRVLEAKLICPNGLVISLCSVFMENIEGRYVKQDCETKAFYRLAEDLKRAFPQLHMVLLLDALYATEPVLDICLKNNWSFFITFKEGSVPTLWQQAMDLRKRHGANNQLQTQTQRFSWACNLTYRNHQLHAVFGKYLDSDSDSEFAYLTNHRPKAANAEYLVNEGGRPRWKIENEGFNTQVTGGYNLRHIYGGKGFAWKNYYYLLQLAHLLLQLMANTDLFGKLQRDISGKALKTGDTVLSFYGSIKNFVKCLGESFRQRCFSTFARTAEYSRGIQIRFVPFDTS
jgi:hypothetical protein